MRAGSCLSQEAVLRQRPKAFPWKRRRTSSSTSSHPNPSQTESQTLPVRYCLSEASGSIGVIDPGRLDVGFDFEKSFYYVYKITFFLQPGEKKIFSVVLRNKWSLDKFYLFTLKVHSDNVALLWNPVISPRSKDFGAKQNLRDGPENDEIQSAGPVAPGAGRHGIDGRLCQRAFRTDQRD